MTSLTLPLVSATPAPRSTASARESTGTSGSAFSEALAQQAKERNVHFSSGRLGLELDRRGQPAKVVYFSETGVRLRSSTFSAPEILKQAHKYGIDLKDLRGLGQQLDAASIGYRPYELYKGTGSDHGIDFEDLIKGGLGTAFDWRQDRHVAAKGDAAVRQLQANQALAESLKLQANSSVTTQRGIDPKAFKPLGAPSESPRVQLMFNGEVAAWYRSAEAARSAAATYRGTTLQLPPAVATVSSAGGPDTLALSTLEWFRKRG